MAHSETQVSKQTKRSLGIESPIMNRILSDKKHVIDTSAWIEYINGSEKASKFKEIIENSIILTSIITIAELSDKFERDNKDFSPAMNFINSRSKISEISISQATEAGKLKNKMRKTNKKFGLADAIIYVLAKSQNSALITADKDFEGLENVIIV